MMLLCVTLLSHATYHTRLLYQDDKGMSKKAKKDKPMKPVPIFVAPKAPDLKASLPSRRSAGESVAPQVVLPRPYNSGRIDTIGIVARLDSLLESCKTQTVTTTQYTRAGRRGKRRAVKVTKTVQRKYTLGLHVYDMTADSVVYSSNAQEMLTPASTQKLFVATTFLEKNGRDFTFDTSLSTNGTTLTDSVGRRYFKGDIYLKGSFDPTLTINDVRSLSNAIHALNVDSIDGRIVVDDHLKASVMRHKGWEWDRIPLSEEYVFTPVTFNEGKAINSGRVRHPELYFASTIAKQLMADSIKFSTSEPWDASMTEVKGKRELYRLVTPCQRVLSRMLKRSNNIYAESVMLNICPDNGEWSYERCRDAVRSTVLASVRHANKQRQKGMPRLNEESLAGYYTVIDGSGLSHSNKSTAESQVNLLRYIYSRNNLFNEMYTHLPIAGVDGTISKRMAGAATKNNVRAKTGTVNAVSTLSGYVTAPSGHLLAFAILVNGTYDMGFARNLQDKICTELAQ